MKVFILTAYVAAQGSFFYDGDPGIFDAEECIIAAPKGTKMGTVYELWFDGSPTRCVVKDRIGTPLAPNHLDILMESRGEAIEFGKQRIQGTLVEKTNV